MAEYIEREALQKLFNEVSTSLLCKKELAKDTEHMVRAFLMVTEMIQDAPPADVAPVVHGKWCPVEATGIGNAAKCSECEKRLYGYEGFKFCPNCGADMRPEPPKGE